MSSVLRFALAAAGLFLAGAGGSAAEPAPESPDPAALGEMTLHVIPQSHIDLAWWWRYDPETVQVIARHTLETAFGNMERFPDYTFTFLQVPAIEPLEALYPELFYKLRYYVHHSRAIGAGLPNPGAGGAKGRLAIGSAAWCEFDGFGPCGESLVRQFVYGKRYYLRAFGVDVKAAWVQDGWTHPWTLPQILKKCGIESYMFSRPRGQGEQMFWWAGPDGSRVFAYKPLAIEGESLPSQERLNRRLLETRRRYGVADDLTLTGVGNHGGGAIRADVERMRRIMAQREAPATNAAAAAPRMIFSTPERFVKAVLAGPHPFPVIGSELEPTLRGTYTTVGEIKKGNRRSEALLLTLEKFSSIASWLGQRPYPQATLYDLWKKVMLNQFHDVISGTDIPAGTDDALRLYREVAQTGQAELDACLHSLCRRIATVGPGTPMVVFNPLAWARTDAVRCEVSLDAAPAAVRVTDTHDHRLPAQIVGDRILDRKHVITVLFVAEAVPSLGYQVYRLAFGRPDAGPSPVTAGANEIENAYFRVEVDPATGCLRSVFDKEHGREVLAPAGRGNLIQVLEDFGDSEGTLASTPGGAERNDWSGHRCWDVDAEPGIALVERGPARAVIEVRKKFGLARFAQRIALYAGVRRVEFDLAVDWKGRNRMVKVGFPLAVSSPEAAYDIPYGAIRRPSRGEEQAAQKWVDVSAGDYGVSLLNDCRYGFDTTRDTIRMSVLRSPTEPVFATDEAGTHEVKYALYPHAGGWQGAGVVRQAYELNEPLIAILVEAHGGDLPPACSFVTVKPENVVVTVLKKAEDGDGLVLRAYEAEGKSCSAEVTLAAPLLPGAVHGADLLENDDREVPCQANGFKADMPAYSIETFRLYGPGAA